MLLLVVLGVRGMRFCYSIRMNGGFWNGRGEEDDEAGWIIEAYITTSERSGGEKNIMGNGTRITSSRYTQLKHFYLSAMLE